MERARTIPEIPSIPKGMVYIPGMDETTIRRVQIRPARVEDALAIAQVHIESWRATYPGIVPQEYIDSLEVEIFTERWRDRIRASPEMHVYVAEDSTKLIGFASGGPARVEMDGFPGELYSIYLSPHAQSRGIGKRLFWTTADGLQCTGLNGMYVWVLDQNPSQGFYKQMGGRLLSESTIELGGVYLKEISYGWSDLAQAVSNASDAVENVYTAAPGLRPVPARNKAR